jgi:hypothetical protein
MAMAAIEVVWWVVLLGALPLTALAVAELVRIVHHAREIDRLARVALPAARGIATNTEVLAELAAVEHTVRRLHEASELLDNLATKIEGHVTVLVRRLGTSGGG